MKNILFKIACLLLPAMGLQAQIGSFATSSADYEIKNLEKVNSNQLDFSAVPFRNGIVFTSTRDRSTLFGCDSDFTNGYYSDLYFARKDGEGSYGTPELLEGDISGKYHDGTATFTSDQTTMYFSRNNRKGVNAYGNIDLKVYESKISNGYWTDVRELTFNSDDYDSCHPSVTPNGQQLYFASNRPGGYGGMDIYMVEKRGADWSNPVNLGPKVNTASNELFPFISTDGTLYWSTDGWGGHGGMDIFSIKISEEEEGMRTLLPKPINSSGDDFGFTSNFQGTEGFLTSSREGGKGKDDIYSWKFKGQKPQIAHICVIDASNGDRISDAYFEMVPEQQATAGADGMIVKDGVTYLQMEATQMNGKEYLILVPYDKGKEATPVRHATGESCNLKVSVIPGRNYQITVDKPGYLPLRKTVPADEILAFEEYLIPIKGQPPIAMRGEIKDKNTRQPIPFANVNVVNKCTDKEMEIMANRSGGFSFPMDCNCDYEITASKGDYQEDYEVVYSYDIKCEKDNATVLLYLEKDIPGGYDYPEPKFEKGAVIRLDKLYYDYDKHFIRPDAAIELDRVVSYMRKYPSLEIELGSHTDARGSDEYNQALSQRRAEAAVEYIISRGIPRHRITAKGYGEYRLVNRCHNNVNCNEHEHQQNRRTEITVTRFSEDNVRIEDY